MPTVNITGQLVLPDGSPVENRNIVIRRKDKFAEKELIKIILADDVLITTDLFGNVEFDLYNGEYVALYGWEYDVEKYFRFNVPDVAGPLQFSSLVPFPIPDVTRDRHYVKRGDTIQFGCVYLNQYGVPQSLDGITVSAAMEHESALQRYEFSVAKTDVSAGRFDAAVASGVTSSAPVGWYNFDIKFDDGLHVSHTLNGMIHVAKEIA